MRIFRRPYNPNTMKNRRKATSNKHNNSQSQPQHAHRTAGKDYHEKNVNINGGTFNINVNIGDKHQDTKTLITDVTRGLQQAVATMADAGEAEEWEDGAGERTEGPAQKGMADLVAPGLDKQNGLGRLHRAIEGRSGVEVPRILMVARDMGLLTKVPSWDVAREEFGQIGAQSGYYKGKEKGLTDDETERYTAQLRQELDKAD